MTRENLFQIATLAARDGQYVHAQEFFKKAIEVDPKFAPAYNGLGLLFQTPEFADYKEAARYFKLATDVDGNYIESWNNLGHSYYVLGDFKSAELAFKESLKVKPGQPEIEITLGWVYLLGQSKAAEALTHFQKGMKDRDDTMVHYGMGLAYLINGDRYKVLDSITQLRSRGRDDLALKLEKMINEKVRITSKPGTPLVTGMADPGSVFTRELKALGMESGDGIKVRLRGPLQP
jgi:tetratricopeptide (TPR) repeat protein